jgi:hypothetical protein
MFRSHTLFGRILSKARSDSRNSRIGRIARTGTGRIHSVHNKARSACNRVHSIDLDASRFCCLRKTALPQSIAQFPTIPAME